MVLVLHALLLTRLRRVKGIDLGTSGSAVVLLCYAGCSCGRLQVGMVVAGEVQGLVDGQLQLVCM